MVRVVSVLAVLAMVAGPATALAETGTPSDRPAVQAERTGGFQLLDARTAAFLSAAFGAAVVVIGGAKAIARIGTSAVESMARQPEASGSVSTATIITAAMVEGATLFAIVVCLLVIIFCNGLIDKGKL